ncbi:MAG: 5-formyltetrahydrofolate cyclo-ligase [Deltaproteobacteria bacterium]|nr:5-formyltetrahydrofolate cyclo-ligase [Deltaproteobacteria bacterium]
MVGQSKADVRRELLRRREAQLPDVRSARSGPVQGRFLQLAPVLAGSSVALYSPIRGEVDTALIFERTRRDGKRVAFPVALPAEGRLEFYVVDDLRELVPGNFGIAEPSGPASRRLDPREIDVIAVPGVAFDHQGRRLGYGGGYYDRLLGSTSTRPQFVVGVAFDDQILDEVPHDGRDASMDTVVTESNTYSRVRCVGAADTRSLSTFEGV